ncbi:hypothetical protein DACRYDRAFT_117279 [Dacryopinax primogenitus]|uniref:Uncharacterized protein n=1 Tax=Dacryopinax primogenitus (strain DJM 731) TaxID=1858805 RepID=M5FS88_DACPD|nr:uncharacterized protein DACRYDRAFT_117279 [Dacryopinax primogenitus]EJU00221.1 hypothetical protein DACRYDRAFT_117279 [Dacryopinax primogenitus]
MATTIFTGPNLNNKRKEELVTIAVALGVPNAEKLVRDGLIKGIKTSLADNRDTFSSDPRFLGLYPAGRSRRATTRLTVEGEEEEDESSEVPATANGSAIEGLVEAAIERAEAKEAAEVVAQSTEIVIATSPSSVVLARPGTARSFDWKKTPFEWLEATRELLSDPELIAVATLIADVLWLVYTILPVRYQLIKIPSLPRTAAPPGTTPVTAPRLATIAIAVPQVSLATFQALFTWALPSLIIPYISGSLISLARPRKQLDPITFAIVRLACVWAQGDIGGVPSSARIVGALVSLLFAFASAIYEASETTTNIIAS